MSLPISQEWTKTSLALMLSALLAGCGGGGSSNDSTAEIANVTGADPNGVPATDWVAGEYQPAATFKDYCAAPRSGIDPFTGEAYPDKQGKLAHEMHYLRSFTNETYLWYDEVPDLNPASFSNVLSYFEQLKTSERTNSGKAKDEFHFTDSYESFMQTSQSGVSEGYGINWSFIALTAPRNLTVAFNEDNSPADLAGVNRGDQLVRINNIDFINTNSQTDIDQINEALFSPVPDTAYEFEFETVDGERKVVSLTPEVVGLSPVMNAQVVQSNGKQVGYVQFNSFIAAAQDPLIAAFEQFEDAAIDELVLDLRYNGGGLLFQAAQVGYLVGGEATQNRVFGTLAYNDKRRAENEDIRFIDQGINWDTYQFTNQQLPTANVERVVILTTNGTASASEAVINGLRGVDIDVVLIGENTRGKPYGFTPQPNCDTVYYTVQFRSENEKDFGDYADGFIPTDPASITTDIGVDEYVPGCAVADDFSKLLGDPQEALFSAALHFIDTGECPVSAIASQEVSPVLSSMMPFAQSLPIDNPQRVYTDNTIYQPVQQPAPWQ